jgi:hypothetical protein
VADWLNAYVFANHSDKNLLRKKWMRRRIAGPPVRPKRKRCQVPLFGSQ